MATSRYQGHCRTSALEDDDHDNVVIMPKTTSVTPLAGNIPSTPHRNNQVLGLVTPLATPDSRSRPNSLGFRFTSPPRTPVRRPDVPKDTKLLTVSGNPSEWSSDQLITIPFLPLTGLLTPDNTPPRLSKPRPIPKSSRLWWKSPKFPNTTRKSFKTSRNRSQLRHNALALPRRRDVDALNRLKPLIVIASTILSRIRPTLLLIHL
ncbi:hypothetical protein BD769DRAFT_875946 [Suillus cothurnatus]|nr:hypothetical protein BD769DRAFT_875946 [Suillus cothurnatus]